MKAHSSWRFFKIKDIGQIISGSTPKSHKPEYWDGDILWATPKDLAVLQNRSVYISDTEKKITEAGYKSCSTTLIPRGSVLFSSRAPIGHIAIAKNEICTNQGFKSIIPFENIDSLYLYFCLKYFTPQIQSLGRGATFLEISKSIFGDFELPFPENLSEQQRIAAVLYMADALCQKRRETLGWLDQLVQSTFYEMFYKNSARESWELCDIQSLAQTHKNSMRTGPFGSDLLHSEFVDEGISVIGIDNAVHNYFSWGEKRFITEEKYEKLKRYTLYPRDVIITIMGTTGRSAVVPEDIPLCINTKHLAAITFNPELANPYFISYSIHSGQDILEQIHLRNRGAIMSGLNLGIIKELKIRKPPIELQNRFETALLEIYARQKAYQESLQNLEALFDSLMYHAFQGHLVFSEEGIENLMAQMQAEAA